MDLANIECQLAQAQMSRYLAGDQLPEDTVVQLEKHVSSCPNCSAAAEEKKISLVEMLAQSQANPVEPPEIDVAPEPNIRAQAAPAEDPLALSDDAVAAALRALEEMPEPAEAAAKTDDVPADEPEEGECEAAPKKKFKLALPIADWKQLAAKNAKPMLFGFLLGAVLIGMSAFVKSPTAMLGKKVMASDTAKEPTEDASESKDSSEKKSKKHHSSEESDTHADSPKTPDHHSESAVAANPEHESKPAAKQHDPVQDQLTAASSGVQEYAVAKDDGTMVHKAYIGEKPVPNPPEHAAAKPAAKPAAKAEAKPAPKPAPKPVVKPAPKPVQKAPVYKKRAVHRAPVRVHRTRATHRSHHSSQKDHHRDLKPGQGFVKVYD